MPSGALCGLTSSASASATSSRISVSGRPSRSTLLTKVMIGTLRRRHTSNSLRVCGSMPLAASITMIAESTAVSVRYVSSLKSSWPGVSSRLKTVPSFWNVITLEVTEMPRCCSIFIQSLRARRACPRALTSPARWIAPPCRSNFSVSVVLPASGCEMMAKVRRLDMAGRALGGVHRHVEAEAAFAAGAKHDDAWLVAQIAHETLRIVEAVPRLDRQEGGARLLPNAQVRAIGKRDVERRAVLPCERQRAAVEAVP